MIRLALGDRPGPINVLVIGAHADDIEIGCGGTILRLAHEGRLAAVRWVVLSAAGPREAEAQAGAAAFLAGVARTEVDIQQFRDGFFPYAGGAIKEAFEAGKSGFEPDLILTHRLEDRHQDHRLVSELTWNTYRNHLILEYEIAKYDADLGAANVHVTLPESIVARKIELISQTFASQRPHHWFDAEAFRGLMRLRGIEANSEGGYAEAFTGRKLVL